MQKLVGQFVITGIFAWYLLNSGEVGTDMLIPFTGGFDGGKFLSLGILFIPALFFIVLGTDNGVNLHGRTGRTLYQRDHPGCHLPYHCGNRGRIRASVP